MKITVIFGEDTVKSRARLLELTQALTKRSWEIINITGGGIPDNLATGSLFSSERVFVLESPSAKLKAELVKIFKYEKLPSVNFIIWLDGNVPADLKKVFPKETNFEEYKLPVTIFKFLDSIYPGNAKASLNLFGNLKGGAPTEFVISLVAQMLRDLYTLKLDGKLGYPSWREGKLSSQAAKFTFENLETFILDLSEVDYKAKIGKLELAAALEYTVATNLS